MGERNFSNVTNYLLEDVNSNLVKDALENINSGKVVILGFSGKKSSGKDTISDKVSELIAKERAITVKQTPFAFRVKQEVTSIISSMDAILRAKVSVTETTERLAKVYDIPVEQMADIVHTMLPYVGKGTDVPDGWTRSEAVWTLLRYVGTDVRQPQDKLYWVRRTFQDVLAHAASGRSVFINDVRFMHEVEPLQAIGGFVTRVDVSREKQLERLFQRDGVWANEEALNHASEISLDNYNGFDCRIDNSSDGGLDEKASNILASWKRSN